MTDLSTRYGTRRRPRWFWPAIAAAGIAVGIAFAAWVGFQDKPVTGRLWGYDVVTPEPIAVRCTVYAQAYDHSIVGEKTVDVAPSDTEKTRITIDVETERKAVTGVLRTCIPAN